MNGDKCDGKVSARQQHREVPGPGAVGKKFGLARKPESDLVHPRFVDGRGHDRVELVVQDELRCFLEPSKRSLGSFRCRLA